MRRSAGPRAGEGASPICSTDSSPGSRITIARIGDGSPQASRPSQSGRARLDLVRGATYASGQPMLVLVLLVAALVAVALWRLAARVRDEDRLGELPPRDTPMLVHCAAGGRSAAACQTLGQRGYTRLLNLAGGMHSWPGVRVEEAGPATPPPSAPAGAAISYRGGPLTEAQVVGAIRECYDPEIPLNIYDLGLIYGVDIDESRVAVRMTLTSEGCPSARTIPEDVKRKIAALGQPNVTVDVVWDPPWHPSRISPDGKQKLGLA